MPEAYKQSFKQNFTDNVELSVFSCGLEKCVSGFTWGPGIRDHYLIHLVLSGQGYYKTKGERYLLKAGDLFLVKPSQLNSYTADMDDPWEYAWVGFNGAHANKLVTQLPFSDTQPYHHATETAALRTLLTQMYEARGLTTANECDMIGYLYLFISTLMKETIQSEPRNTTSGSQYVLNAIKFIQFNYSHNISIDDVSKSVGVSRSHLYRVFISNLGKSPIDYLTEYRIEEACNLLKTSNLSIAEIAISVGFFDQFYFSRVFKKATGVPPSKYIASIASTQPNT
ncbi:MAG: AraC family transcriptional regulator [Faecalibacterium sp.]